MITFSLDHAIEETELKNREIYPEWAKRERFYNCENFYQSMSHENIFPLHWFHKKAANQ